MNSNEAAIVGLDRQRHIDVAYQRQRMHLIVIDCDCVILYDSIAPGESELRLLLSDDRKSFRGEATEVVRSLVTFCLRNAERQSHIAFLDSQRFVRVTRLDGITGSVFAVAVEKFRSGDSLSRATRKYQLTPREVEVLALILEGASAIETAQALKIAETTVQGYYKRLLSKTNSRNRPAMVANVLDWDGRSGQRQK